jgi:predicted oxidoreductase
MMILILGEILLTPLQLLDFQQLPTILSHFDDFFGVIMGQERFSKAFFTNLLPLSPKGNGVLTFLQQSHYFLFMWVTLKIRIFNQSAHGIYNATTSKLMATKEKGIASIRMPWVARIPTRSTSAIVPSSIQRLGMDFQK